MPTTDGSLLNTNTVIRRSYNDGSLDVAQPPFAKQSSSAGRLKSTDSCTINIPESDDPTESLKAESEQPVAA